MSLKDTILASKSPLKQVTVPQWGCDVWIKEMSALDRMSLLQYVEGKDTVSYSCAILARCLCDSEGVRLFTDTEEDVKQLAGKEASVVEQLTLFSLEHNKMTTETREEVKKN